MHKLYTPYYAFPETCIHIHMLFKPYVFTARGCFHKPCFVVHIAIWHLFFFLLITYLLCFCSLERLLNTNIAALKFIRLYISNIVCALYRRREQFFFFVIHGENISMCIYAFLMVCVIFLCLPLNDYKRVGYTFDLATNLFSFGLYCIQNF